MISKKIIATMDWTKSESTPIISNPAERPNQKMDSSLFEVIARRRNPAIPNPVRIQKMANIVTSKIVGTVRAKSPKITPIMPLMRHESFVSVNYHRPTSPIFLSSFFGITTKKFMLFLKLHFFNVCRINIHINHFVQPAEQVVIEMIVTRFGLECLFILFSS